MEGKTGYLKAIKKLHLAMLLGQCGMLGVMLFLVVQKIMPPGSAALDKPLQIAALLVSFAGVWGGYTIFKKMLLLANAADNMAGKLEEYRKALLVQWALTEAAVLSVVICFFLVGNYSFAALAAALIIFFALQAPNKVKLLLHLQLTEQEADSL
jgi:hypothetical protein